MQTGIQLKEQGQLLALANAGQSWVEQAMTLLKAFLATEAGPTFRWEQFRAYALHKGLPNPPHHNAWGGLPNKAVKRGLIEFTGRLEEAQSKKTHGHLVRVWRAVA